MSSNEDGEVAGCSKSTISSNDDRIFKFNHVICKEFSEEIANKERRLAAIDERLLLARKTFQKLRYAIVNSFYNTKKLSLSEDEIKREIYQQKDPDSKSAVQALLTEEQKRIHPAIKTVLSESLILNPYEISSNRFLRKRSAANSDDCPKSKLSAIEHKLQIDEEANYKTEKPNTLISKMVVNGNYDAKIPMYVGPKNTDDNVLKIDTIGRNRHKNKFRIIIGNTSKYVEPTAPEDPITHKWLLYIRGPQENPDLSHIVDSIIINLHDSYAPHNVIKLKSYPFHLTKRGWGEFPVKLKINFKNGLFNKPINLEHQLKLDRYRTGLQTLGGETVADVWLTFDNIPGHQITNELNTIQNIKVENPDTAENSENGFESFNYKTENGFEDNEMDVKIKNEPMELEEISFQTNDMFYNNNIDRKSINENSASQIDHDLLNRIFNEHSYTHIDEEWFQKGTIESDYNTFETSLLNEIDAAYDRTKLCNWYRAFGYNFDDSDITIDIIIRSNKKLIEKILNKSQQHESIDVIQIASINSLIMSHFMKELFAIFNSNSTGNHLNECINILNDAISTNESILDFLGQDDNLVRSSEFLGLSGLLLSRRQIINIVETLIKDLPKITDLRCAVNLMLKFMPMVDKSAYGVEYKYFFPFAVESEERFFALDLIKRRNLLWTRAKIINNLLKKHYASELIWTTKQILVFSLYHGYYPCKSGDNPTNPSDFDVFFKSKETFESVSQINTKIVVNVSNLASNPNIHSKLYDYHDSLSDGSDDEIDVVVDDVNKKTSPKKINVSDQCDVLPFDTDDEKQQCQYIEKVCSDLGIELRNQNIGNGFVYGLPHKALLTAIKCFADDVMRRSLSLKIESMHSLQENPSIWNICENDGNQLISIRQIFEALRSRPEFDFATNSGLGLEEIDFKGEV